MCLGAAIRWLDLLLVELSTVFEYEGRRKSAAICPTGGRNVRRRVMGGTHQSRPRERRPAFISPAIATLLFGSTQGLHARASRVFTQDDSALRGREHG